MKKNYPLSTKQLQIRPISCQVKPLANTATDTSIDEKTTPSLSF